ncbi:hypothetical protein DSCO28_55940 [Desulfosarcina ovata subsp. sediminis]|uniref:L-dopachrome isomerase n=1 Tax=Desulfosarcina ovata subsp. sediminis TaxID=885957 RepID=A0A5K7ZXR6_9BACT|nr:phenylpyruvate tautomerase MIF-related protein [Desulfosarcina ovata]BBO85028.1 hypothetical protein DSCO28_55940 [Desulfosarcina ovata subsp. sediminis]
MPFFKIETNQPINPDGTQRILKKASQLVSEILGKPEQYVMVSIEPGQQMMFNGNDDPTAFVQLKSIGLAIDSCADFSSRICQFIAGELGIAADRVYIDFTDLERNMFGWNGKTF